MAKKAKAKVASKAKPAAKSKPAAKGKAAPKAAAKPAPKKAAPKAAPAAASPSPAPVAGLPGVPPGKHSLVTYLTVRGAAQAIDFYKHAFGAVEVMRMPGPDGFSIMHAEVTIGDSALFVMDEMPQMGCSAPPTVNGANTASLHLYVADVDAAYQQAIDAGAKPGMPVADMFWGDRYGQVIDPFGHRWGLATHKETLSLAEIGKRAQDFFGKMANQPPA